jgi:hypothetical protein
LPKLALSDSPWGDYNVRQRAFRATETNMAARRRRTAMVPGIDDGKEAVFSHRLPRCRRSERRHSLAHSTEESSLIIFCRVMVMLTGIVVIPLIAIAWTALPETSREIAAHLFPEWISPEAEEEAPLPEAPRYSVNEDSTDSSRARPLGFSSPIEALQTSNVADREGHFPSPSLEGLSRNGAPDTMGRPLAATPNSRVLANASETPRSFPADRGSTEAATRMSRTGFEETSAREIPLEKGIYREKPAPGALAVGEQNRFARLEKELVELGATYYRLETWGDRREWYRFSCFAAPDGNASTYTRPFESLDRDPIRAIEKVLRQIRSWKGL